MVEAFGNARSQDTNSARYEVPTFVPLDPLMDVVQPPITNTKSARGFNHPIVGKLLCPLQLHQEYEADPMWVIVTCTMPQTELVPLYSLFKNKIENATLQFCSHDERNWPSFLYPPGSEYNTNELDKGLFRGPIVIRVCSFLSLISPSNPVKIFIDIANDLYRQRFSLHWLSICPKMFPSGNAWHAWGVSWSSHLCCCPGESTEDQLILTTSKWLLRLTTAFVPSMVGTPRITSSSWMFSLISVLGCSRRIPMIHGLSIPSNS